jgi:hypothetical protein
MPREDIKKFLGTRLEDTEGTVDEVSYGHLLDSVELPESFDAR